LTLSRATGNFFLIRHPLPFLPNTGKRRGREKERGISIGRGAMGKKRREEHRLQALFAPSMTELIETTRSGTRFPIFKGASSGAFLRYFSLTERQDKSKTGRVRRMLAERQRRDTEDVGNEAKSVKLLHANSTNRKETLASGMVK